MEQVLLVDPDRVAAGMLGCVLLEVGLTTQIVGSIQAALEAARTGAFALVVLEVDLPDGDGVDLALELRGRRYRGPLVFVSGRASLADLLRGYRAGADDYIAKPYEPAAILAKFSALWRRCAAADAQPLGEQLRVADAELDLGTLTYSSPGVPGAVLDPTALRLLACLMRNPAVVIGRETLIQRVWGYDYEGDTNRVDVYIRRLRHKIEADPAQPAYLQTVRGLGYTFRPPVVSTTRRAEEPQERLMLSTQLAA